jgi:membrane protease YdiL (CAAX protease family)
MSDVTMTEQPVQSEPLEYHRLYRAGRPGWWWAGLASVPLAFFFLIFSSMVLVVPFLLGFLIAGEPVGDSMQNLIDLDHPTPLGLAYLNLTLAAAIPFTFLVVWVFHQLRPGWLTSVAARMRWRYFAACLGLSVVALIATVLVSLMLPQQPAGDISGNVNDFSSTTRDFLLVVLLLTPLQAAGEEYLFRGYVMQAIGSLFPPSTDLRMISRVVAVLVSALFFAFMHGFGQSVPIFLDRFAFGLVAGVLVIATGGLEAGIAMHVLNNFLAFGFALAFGDMASALNPTGGSWWMIVSTLTQSLVYLGLALPVARAMGLTNRAEELRETVV